MNRRTFFQAGERQAIDAVAACVEEVAQLRKGLTAVAQEVLAVGDSVMDSFFDSYEESYSLTLAYPREFFEQMARAAGIHCDERETLDIVRDLYRAGKLG
ncbi:MAG: hypothetical protein IH614_11605 [Desulfuromonadales bacterium]|nr:hypothetical protein [Desulfuromonadales bacterium]